MTKKAVEDEIRSLLGDRNKLMIRIHYFDVTGRITSIELNTGTKRNIVKYGGHPRDLANEYAGRATCIEVA